MAGTPPEDDPLKRLRAWQRFHIKLIALYGGTVLLALVLLAGLFYRSEYQTQLVSIQQRLLALVTSLASSIDPAPIAAVPIDSAEPVAVREELLRRFKEIADRDPDVESIYILRPTGEPTRLRFFVDYSKKGISGEPGSAYDAQDVPILLKGFARAAVEDRPYADSFGVTLSGYAPIFDDEGRSVALVGADVQADHLHQMRRRILANVLAIFGIAALVIGFVSYLVARSVREPLNRIITAASAVERGELTTRLGMQRSDEFGLVSQHFDRMVSGLQEREILKQTFGRYLSGTVAKLLLATPGQAALRGEERVVTVLFADLRGYSVITEWLAPSKVVEILNEYMGVMDGVISAFQGCLIDFVGDAIMAVFGAPDYLPDHAERAVRCAIEMNQKLHEMNVKWRASGLASSWKGSGVGDITARIGIHSGPVIAGNVGSESRMKYAVIGETVNVAARLEAMNKDLHTDILISGEVYMHLPQDLTGRFADKGEHRVKGRELPVRVFAIQLTPLLIRAVAS